MYFQSVGQDTLAEQPLRIHWTILQRYNLDDRKGTENENDCFAWGWRTVLAMGGGSAVRLPKDYLTLVGSPLEVYLSESTDNEDVSFVAWDGETLVFAVDAQNVRLLRPVQTYS